MIPIVLTAYNRLDTLKQTLDSLYECEGMEDRLVVVYSDGGKDDNDKRKVMDVRRFLVRQNVITTYNERNFGLRENSLKAINDAFNINMYDKIIFLQDDVQVSKDFLTYQDWALNEFEDRKDIMFVSGYSHITYPDCYLSPLIADGLGIWKNKFEVIPHNEYYYTWMDGYKCFAEYTTPAFASYLKDIITGKSDAFMMLLAYEMYMENARCLHPGMNKLRYCVSDSTNTKKKDSKNLNNNLYEGFNKRLDESDCFYNIIKETKNYKWSKLKQFTRWLSGNR